MAVAHWILAALTILAAGSAAAQDATKPAAFNERAFPREVRKALQYAHDECGRQGGGRVTFASDTVRKLDLTGDGRDDYIVDLRDTGCDGRESVYCGTAGCTFDIIVALKGGGHRTVFSARVRTCEIMPGEGAKTIRFMLHGSYCGGSGSPSVRVQGTAVTTPPAMLCGLYGFFAEFNAAQRDAGALVPISEGNNPARNSPMTNMRILTAALALGIAATCVAPLAAARAASSFDANLQAIGPELAARAAQRMAAMRACKQPGGAQSDRYRACMAEHGQKE
jgi:hypothetical protein